MNEQWTVERHLHGKLADWLGEAYQVGGGAHLDPKQAPGLT